ncbi:MAG TPA: hypothetical protein VFG50_11515 [Rhodothermales bacterium]|nr:hypothetical protein [Rhodothermales bacterium]
MASSEVRIGFGRLGLTVHADDPEIPSYVARIFREFASTKPRDISACFDVAAIDGAYEISLDGRLLGRVVSATGTQRRLVQEIVRHVIESHRELLWLHAGAVAHNGRAMMLVGRFGAGKSTFTTALAARNWRYLSDDVAPVDVETARVLPFPTMPMVRVPTGADLPEARLPELRKRPVDLPAWTICRDPVPLSTLVFPKYSHGAPCSLVKLSPSEAALQVLHNCTSYEHDRRNAVAAASRLAAAVPAYALLYGEAQPAADVLESLMRTPARP